MDKNFLAKVLGAFLALMWEHALGKTPYGSTVGLAKAASLAMLKTIANLFKKRPTDGPQEKEKP